jgi:hypothetical protein
MHEIAPTSPEVMQERDKKGVKRRPGRPAGEVRQALLRAVEDLVLELRAAGSPFQGPTLQEIMMRACIGRKDARVCITHCKRSGALRIVGQRRVAYRNRPVSEYAPGSGRTGMTEAQAANAEDVARLTACLQGWAR